MCASLVRGGGGGGGGGGGRDEVIQAGDLVIVYESSAAMKAVEVEDGKVYHSRLGMFPHTEWIGKRFGTCVWNKLTHAQNAAMRAMEQSNTNNTLNSNRTHASHRADSSQSITTNKKRKSGPGRVDRTQPHERRRSYVYLLAPTPELWTLVLPHRTQVLYMADIALMIAALRVRPGCIVLETGTGSGSMTHALARSVGSRGKVKTFDFHAGRVDTFRAEMQRHGLEDRVEAYLRDTQTEGFPETLTNQADAVVLDLPRPYDVVVSAARCLKMDGRIASFSPCMEQVQATCEAMRQCGFVDIETVEVLARYYVASKQRLWTDMTQSSRGFAKKKNKKTSSIKSRVANEEKPTDDCDEHGDYDDEEDPERWTICTRPVSDARGHTGYITHARKRVDIETTESAAPPSTRAKDDNGNTQIHAATET